MGKDVIVDAEGLPRQALLGEQQEGDAETAHDAVSGAGPSHQGMYAGDAIATGLSFVMAPRRRVELGCGKVASLEPMICRMRQMTVVAGVFTCPVGVSCYRMCVFAFDHFGRAHQHLQRWAAEAIYNRHPILPGT